MNNFNRVSNNQQHYFDQIQANQEAARNMQNNMSTTDKKDDRAVIFGPGGVPRTPPVSWMQHRYLPPAAPIHGLPPNGHFYHPVNVHPPPAMSHNWGPIFPGAATFAFRPTIPLYYQQPQCISPYFVNSHINPSFPFGDGAFQYSQSHLLDANPPLPNPWNTDVNAQESSTSTSTSTATSTSIPTTIPIPTPIPTPTPAPNQQRSSNYSASNGVHANYTPSSAVNDEYSKPTTTNQAPSSNTSYLSSDTNPFQTSDSSLYATLSKGSPRPTQVPTTYSSTYTLFGSSYPETSLAYSHAAQEYSPSSPNYTPGSQAYSPTSPNRSVFSNYSPTSPSYFSEDPFSTLSPPYSPYLPSYDGSGESMLEVKGVAKYK